MRSPACFSGFRFLLLSLVLRFVLLSAEVEGCRSSGRFLSRASHFAALRRFTFQTLLPHEIVRQHKQQYRRIDFRLAAHSKLLQTAVARQRVDTFDGGCALAVNRLGG